MFFTACFFTANSPGIQGGVGAEIPLHFASLQRVQSIVGLVDPPCDILRGCHRPIQRLLLRP